MSGGISNLGMGYEPQRYDSTPILGADYYAQQAAAQQQALAQQAASIPAPTTPTSYLDSLIQQQQQALQSYYQSAGIDWRADDPYNRSAQIIRDSLQGQGTINPAMGNIFGDNVLGTNFYQQYQNYVGSQPGTSIGGAAGGNIGDMASAGTATPGAYQPQQAAYQSQISAIDQQAQAAAKAAADAEAARANNQATQQQAYNQQTGGGFAGGIINSSYSQPFGNTITGTANTGGFSGGMMGAPSTAAASTGLNPTGPAAGMLGTGFGAAAPSVGASAWGGPFSNKNPWSLG